MKKETLVSAFAHTFRGITVLTQQSIFVVWQGSDRASVSVIAKYLVK